MRVSLSSTPFSDCSKSCHVRGRAWTLAQGNHGNLCPATPALGVTLLCNHLSMVHDRYFHRQLLYRLKHFERSLCISDNFYQRIAEMPQHTRIHVDKFDRSIYWPGMFPALKGVKARYVLLSSLASF